MQQELDSANSALNATMMERDFIRNELQEQYRNVRDLKADLRAELKEQSKKHQDSIIAILYRKSFLPFLLLKTIVGLGHFFDLGCD